MAGNEVDCELSFPFRCIEWRVKKESLNSDDIFESKRFNIDNKIFCFQISTDSKLLEHEIRLVYYEQCECYEFDQQNDDLHASCYVYSTENPFTALTVGECKSMKWVFDDERDEDEEEMILGSFSSRNLLKEHKESPSESLTILLKIFKVVKDGEAITSKSESILMQNLEDLFLSEREADVLILVKESQFRCHRSILAERSKVFAAMFQEKNSGEVIINDCDSHCFKNFLLYLYSGKRELITGNNAQGLYYIANKYDVEDLKKFCIRCMMQNLNTDLICDVLVVVSISHETNLLEAATQFFCENAEEIIQTCKWADFVKTHFALSNDLLLKSFRNLKSKLK